MENYQIESARRFFTEDPDRLLRWNHVRGRMNAPELKLEEAIELLALASDQARREIKDYIQ